MVRKNLTNLISVSFAGRIFGSCFQYGIILVVGRWLGATSLGLFSFGLVILNLGTLVSKLGLDKAAKKYIPEYVDSKNGSKLTGLILLCLVLPLVTGVTVSVLLYTNADLISSYSSESFSTAVALFLIGIPFMSVMTVGQAATTGFINTKYSVYIKDIGQSGLAFGLIVVASLVLQDLQAVIIGYVISIIFASILAMYYLHRLGAFDAIRNIRFEVKSVLKYSVPLVFVSVSQYLISWTDVLMLGSFETAAAVGKYQAAFQTAAILGLLPAAVTSIFPSVASKLYVNDQLDQLQLVFASLTKWISYFTALGFVFIVVHSQTILSLFGREFTDIGNILLILAGVNVLTALVGPAGFLLVMTDHERLETANTVLSAVLNIILNFIFIQEFGVLGAALATGTSMLLANTARLLSVWKLLDIRPDPKYYWKGVTAIILSTPIMFLDDLISQNHILEMLLAGSISLAMFIGILYFLNLDKDDRVLLQEI